MHAPLLSVVLVSGLIDSFNPCAISLLLIYISMMFTLRKSRKEIFAFGLLYVISVYITYFMIGLVSAGLLKNPAVVAVFKAHVTFTSNPISKIAAIIVIIFGLLNIKEYFFPNAPFIYITTDF